MSTLHIPIKVQEALGPEETGVDRVQDPVSVGIPLKDENSVKDIKDLGLAGVNRGQFRILGRWPSGNIKWVLIDTLVDLKTGETADFFLTQGEGNFGGSDLAVDEGGAIRINTGPGEFTIRKRYFNLFDGVEINHRIVVPPESSKGLVLLGPPAGSVKCHHRCTSWYYSSLDSFSDAVIEENGPVKAIIKATGYHRDAAGNPYLGFTVRMTFYYGKTGVSVKVYLRNADTPLTPAHSAFKEFKLYEMQISSNLGEKRFFSIPNHSGLTSGFLASAEESVFLYQAYSDYKEDASWGLYQLKSVIPRTGTYPFRYAQEGYVIQKDSELLSFGNKSQYTEGWAQIFDESGTGIQIGIGHLNGFWPKSLEFLRGGRDVVIGLFPKQNTETYWQAYPHYSVFETLINFHDTYLASPSQEFKKSQHFLIGRVPDVSYYNEAGALPYPLLNIGEEDSYYQKIREMAQFLGASTSLQTSPSRLNLDYKISRMHAWHDERGSNQYELRFNYLMKWLAWGMPGFFLHAKSFYLYQESQAIPRADGFDWRTQDPSLLNYKGYPKRSLSLFNEKTSIFRPNQDHAHWWGMIFYYFLTGDEGIKEAIWDHKARFNNPKTEENEVGPINSRGLGNLLMSHAMMHEFLSVVGDEESGINLQLGDMLIRKNLLLELEVSGSGPPEGKGLSKTRGFHWLGGFDASGNRIAQAPHMGILVTGLYHFYKIRGDNTPQAQEILDSMEGMARWWLQEAFLDTGTIITTGTSLANHLDIPDSPQGTTASNLAILAWWGYELTGVEKFLEAFKKQLARNLYSNFSLEQTASHTALAAKASLTPRIYSASGPITDLQAQRDADGSIRLTWTGIKNAQRYEIKYSQFPMVEWLGFNPKSMKFANDPEIYVPWFSAKNLGSKKGKGGPQSLNLVGLDKNSRWFFAIRSYQKEGPASPLSNVAMVQPVSEAKTKNSWKNSAKLPHLSSENQDPML